MIGTRWAPRRARSRAKRPQKHRSPTSRRPRLRLHRLSPCRSRRAWHCRAGACNSRTPTVTTQPVFVVCFPPSHLQCRVAGLFDAFTEVKLPKSLVRAQEKEAKRKEKAQEKKRLARRVSFGSSPSGAQRSTEPVRLGQEEIGATMVPSELDSELAAVRLEYPRGMWEARLMRLAEVLYGRYERVLPPILNNWDAPLCYVNAESRSLLDAFVAEVPEQEGRSFVQFILSEEHHPALRVCASLAAQQWPQMVLAQVRSATAAAQARMATYLLVAVARTSEAAAVEALQVFLSRELNGPDSVDGAALEALVARVGTTLKLDDVPLAQRLAAQWLPSARGAQLWLGISSAIKAQPEIFEAVFPYAVSDTQAEGEQAAVQIYIIVCCGRACD